MREIGLFFGEDELVWRYRRARRRAPALFVVLASRSPQRKAILRQLGVPFRVAPPSRHDESLVAGDPVASG